MDDVGAPQLAEEKRPIARLGDGGAEVLDALEYRQQSRRNGIDRDEPGADVGVGAPGLEQPLGLNGLPAQNCKRGGHERDAERGQAG